MFQFSWLSAKLRLEEISCAHECSWRYLQESTTGSGFVRAPRGFTSCSPVVIADDGSGGLAARHRGRHVTFSLTTRTNRVRDEWPCALPGSLLRRKLVRSSSRAQSFFLPAFLSFRRYALYGAPVAPACTDHHQMASGDLTRPRATPLRPRNPRHRHPARVTLANEGFQTLHNIYGEMERFSSMLRSLFKLWYIVGKGNKQRGWSNIGGFNSKVNE